MGINFSSFFNNEEQPMITQENLPELLKENPVSTEYVISDEEKINKKTIKLKINGEEVIFHKKSKPGKTASYYVDNDNKYFLKKLRKDYSDEKRKYLLMREVYMLNLLKKHPEHFPTLVGYGDRYFITKYIGKRLCMKNSPKDIYKQAETILNILKKYNIKHCDIKTDEVLVGKNGNLYLTDFGWAKHNNSWECGGLFPKESRKKSGVRNDKKSIYDIIANY